MLQTFFPLALAGLLGLMIGSFLNVVIHRLPRMLQAQWNAPDEADAIQSTPYNLSRPRSHCPHCQHPLRWRDNMPLLSFWLLKGRCAHCQAPISWRYPAIEGLTSALFVGVFALHGFGLQAVVWAGFAAALLALAAIDADTGYLPDAITQPLAWSGLLAASLGLSGTVLNDALWGAVVGYLFLWSVDRLFKWTTGKDGMGQGDFKLLAALGAWLGWQSLLSLVMISSLVGVLFGVWWRMRGRLAPGDHMPFGPYLVLAAGWVMAFGPLPWFWI
jgi:leader peptidase (prepilin peptidase)/N-methyltransferase